MFKLIEKEDNYGLKTYFDTISAGRAKQHDFD